MDVQFKAAVDQATEEVAAKGWQGADLRAVILFAMGHREDATIRVSLVGKLPIAVATLFGAVVTGVATKLIGG